MADISDVETAIVNLIAGAVYPNGTSQPSVFGIGVRIFRGWPLASSLDVDLAAGMVNISVYPIRGEKNTTRYPRAQTQITGLVHTVTTSVDQNARKVTLGGVINAGNPQNVVILVGLRNYFAYGATPTDSPTTIATALAASINAVFPGTSSSGPVITIGAGPANIVARVASSVQAWTEEKRQERSVQISFWCPTPALRDTVAGFVDLTLAQNDFLTLPDTGGSACRLRYDMSLNNDDPEKVNLYRRDLIYCVEYPTSLITQQYETGVINIQDNTGQAVVPAYQKVGINRGFGNNGFPPSPQIDSPPNSGIVAQTDV